MTARVPGYFRWILGNTHRLPIALIPVLRKLVMLVRLAEYLILLDALTNPYLGSRENKDGDKAKPI